MVNDELFVEFREGVREGMLPDLYSFHWASPVYFYLAENLCVTGFGFSGRMVFHILNL